MGPATSFMQNRVDTAVLVAQRPLHPQNKTTGYVQTKANKQCQAGKSGREEEEGEGGEGGGSCMKPVMQIKRNE